jgi:hypothetical protein
MSTLIFYSKLKVRSVIAIHQIRHSILEHSTGFAPMSHLISISCSERAASSTKTGGCKEKLTDYKLQ